MPKTPYEIGYSVGIYWSVDELPIGLHVPRKPISQDPGYEFLIIAYHQATMDRADWCNGFQDAQTNLKEKTNE